MVPHKWHLRQCRLKSLGTFRVVVCSVATQLAHGPAMALRYIKANLTMAETATISQSLDRESMHQARTVYSRDAEEAIDAFLTKRRPDFKGY